MIYFRSLLYQFCLLLSVVIFSAIIILCYPFVNYKFSSKLATSWGQLNNFMLEHICKIKINIQGLHNLPSEGGYIIMCKHQSTWETISLRGLLYFDQAWILKKELISLPFFGLALKITRQIAIDRSKGKKSLSEIVNKGGIALKNNRIVIIFPEGTRVASGNRIKYNVGGALLASKTGSKIIPIAHNAGVFWPKGTILKYPGVIDLVVGEPIISENLKPSSINEMVSNWIESTVESLPKSN